MTLFFPKIKREIMRSNNNICAIEIISVLYKGYIILLEIKIVFNILFKVFIKCYILFDNNHNKCS